MLYPQLLRGDFDKLPRALRLFHSAPGGACAQGTVTVRHVRGWLARLAGFPPAGEGIPLKLQVIASEGREIWIRDFGGAELRTVQTREGDLMRETSGPVRLTFRLQADERGIRLQLRRARFWFVPIPLRIEARESGNDASWDFEVIVAGVGSYRGTMVPTV